MIDNICPYCGNEMQLGYMGGVRYQLEWIPEGKRQRVTLLTKNTGIPLHKFNWIKYHKVYAYRCDKCNVIIMSGDSWIND